MADTEGCRSDQVYGPYVNDKFTGNIILVYFIGNKVVQYGVISVYKVPIKWLYRQY
jgi:hypothetical protein